MVRCEFTIAYGYQAKPCRRHAVQCLEVGCDFPFAHTSTQWNGNFRSQLSTFDFALSNLNMKVRL